MAEPRNRPAAGQALRQLGSEPTPGFQGLEAAQRQKTWHAKPETAVGSILFLAFCCGNDRPGAQTGTEASAQHQHRNFRVREHLLCFAAQQQAFDALAPMRGHHDQVGFVFLGGCNQRVGYHI